MGQGINAQGQVVTFPDPTPDRRTAAAARSAARRLVVYVSQKANALRDSGITVSGIPVSTDAKAIAYALGAKADAEANPSETVPFVVSPTQTVSLTSGQIIAIAAAVTAFIKACFAAEAQANAGLNASPPTITTTAQVDVIFAGVKRAY